MKFVKSDLAKKIIIILVVLMIFNIAIPKKVHAAWNFTGILMKPINTLLLGFLVSIDVQLGLFIQGIDLVAEGVGGIIQQITDAADEGNLTGSETINGVVNHVLSDIFIGPDTIFSGGVSLLNANIFEADTTVDIFEDTNAAADSIENIATDIVYGSNFAGTLKKGIATTYVILRNICAMLMLAGLIFTGIRVLITSNTPNKAAQWRQLIFDWLIGMVLLIFSHVIMYGVFWISDKLTDVLTDNLMGFGGLNFTLVRTCLLSLDNAEQIICLVMLAYLIYLTIVFAISYFKRLLWICVLIVIAPIVSIMYAFGNQTKQIYSKWLREYIMMVLIQPFHLIIYYTLVSVPLNMVSGSAFEYQGLSMFTMIYALGAISFIRPAEKYIRELFGFHQGLAEKASFDSGKQTMDALADAIKKVVGIIAIAATAGAAAPAVGAAEGAAATAEVGTEVAPEVLGSADPSLIGEMNPDNLLADDPGMYDGFSRDPFHEDFYSGDQFFDNDLQNEQPSGMNKLSEEGLQEELDNLGLERGSEERAEMEESYRAAGHGDQIEDNTLQDEQPRGMSRMNEAELQEWLDETGLEKGSEERIDMENSLRTAGHGDLLENIEQEVDNEDIKLKTTNEEDTNVNTETEKSSNISENNKSQEQNNINANNVIINAGNVSMQGNIQEDNAENKTSDTIKTAEEQEDDSDDEKEERKKKENEGKIEIEDEGTPNRKKDGFLKRRTKDMNAAVDFVRGESGISESIKKLSPDSILGKKAQSALETDLGQKFSKFEELGGLKELHKGFNSVRDTFFAGPAPGDWKSTNNKMDENIKKRQEQTKFNITNQFKEQFTEKYFLELKEQYKGNKNYNDARLMDMAKSKADSKLKTLTDTYVPLGVTDANIMLELDDDRKKYGLTAEDAVKQRVQYEKFNVNVKNVNSVNEYLETNNSTIQQSIPKARDYYNNGYTNAKDMARAYELTEILGVTTEYGMKLDKALKNKGSQVNLNLDKRNDLDDKQKERIKTVLDSYSNDKE